MTARPPNELEKKLHQAALADPKKARLSAIRTIRRDALPRFLQVITVKQSEAIIQDTKMREGAINFLLGVGLFKMLKDNQGTVSFRAVAKNEMNAYVAGSPCRGMLTIDISEPKISAERRAWCWVISRQPEMRVRSLSPLTPRVILSCDRYLDQTPQGKDRPTSNGHR
jgi:DNA-directed RNA polymerase III subunit RPC6